MPKRSLSGTRGYGGIKTPAGGEDRSFDRGGRGRSRWRSSKSSDENSQKPGAITAVFESFDQQKIDVNLAFMSSGFCKADDVNKYTTRSGVDRRETNIATRGSGEGESMT